MPDPRCQRCLTRGVWTFQCSCKPGNFHALSKPSRTEQLNDPSKRSGFLDASDDGPPLSPRSRWKQQIDQSKENARLEARKLKVDDGDGKGKELYRMEERNGRKKDVSHDERQKRSKGTRASSPDKEEKKEHRVKEKETKETSEDSSSSDEKGRKAEEGERRQRLKGQERRSSKGGRNRRTSAKRMHDRREGRGQSESARSDEESRPRVASKVVKVDGN